VGKGNEAAVRQCIERFGGLVWSLAQRSGLPRADLDDAVHEVFAEVWRCGGKFDPAIASEATFIATIARRRLIDQRRRLSRRPALQQAGEDTQPATPRVVPADASDEAKRARVAFEELTPDQQRVLRLSVNEGLSHDLIARATGMPLGTVKTHARRGLMRLREALGVPRPAWESAMCEGRASA
jgi:RNA polymerase sigma-70 factor (ECF subfamily)